MCKALKAMKFRGQLSEKMLVGSEMIWKSCNLCADGLDQNKSFLMQGLWRLDEGRISEGLLCPYVLKFLQNGFEVCTCYGVW